MKKLILPLLLLATLTVSAQKSDTTKRKPYRPNPNRVYEWRIFGTVTDLVALVNVVHASDIDASANLSGQTIKDYKRRTDVLIDSLVKQYNRAYKADSLKNGGGK